MAYQYMSKTFHDPYENPPPPSSPPTYLMYGVPKLVYNNGIK